MPRFRRKNVYKKLKKNRLPILLIFAGVLLILSPRLLEISSRGQSLSPKGSEVTAKKTLASSVSPFKIDSNLLSKKDPVEQPLRIVVPNHKLDLPIIEAKVIDGFWEISETTASHGIGSANPGENGNIVIFAHARDNLFGQIKDIKNGEEIYILTKDRWFKYEVIETKFVDPNQVEVIAPTPKETLTLFTCSGFLDSKRLIVKALPVN